ncbi:MAG: DUF1501 domain-containing protein [Microthrixaceae bacterium]
MATHCEHDHPPAGADADTGEHGRVPSRRGFLGVVAAGAGALAWSSTGSQMAFATPAAPATGDVVVLVFLRGGADGLNLVAPFQMPTYRALRPTLRVKDPGEFTNPAGVAGLPLVAGGAVGSFPLSGTFALHPGMEALHAGAWSAGHLAVVHAAGLPAAESSSRSHFDAERMVEAGSATASVTNGFLNRYLTGVPGLDRLGAVGRGSTLPASLRGPARSFSMASIAGFGVRGFSNTTRARTALVSLYDRGSGLLGDTGADTLDVVGLLAALPADPGPQNGAVYGTDDLSTSLRETARLIRADVGLRAVAIDAGGWDTHGEQGVPEDPNGYFRFRAGRLANALQAFYTDLGTAMDEVTLVSVSEFGRTIDENGSGGTDHGRAGAMFVLGRKVRGGVHGAFPDAITQGPEGDLAVLNDYRQVMWEVLSVRGGATDRAAVFPTFRPGSPLGVVVA